MNLLGITTATGTTMRSDAQPLRPFLRPTVYPALNGVRSKASDKTIVEGVRHIKAKCGPDLILWGSSTLTPMLLEHGLADEVLLFVYPVLLGKGKRFITCWLQASSERSRGHCESSKFGSAHAGLSPV
jgi:riboflavin biosynthesis pyrimidine reductase